MNSDNPQVFENSQKIMCGEDFGTWELHRSVDGVRYRDTISNFEVGSINTRMLRLCNTTAAQSRDF